MFWRVILLFAALIAAAELLLRFGVGFGEPPLAEIDPEIEYMLAADKTYRRFGNLISINAHRMRAPEFPARKSTDEWRIMLIGDSVVYGGHHISQDETIAARLAESLRRKYAGCAILVGAIAASSWGPVNELAFIRRYGLFDADDAVIIASSHDLYDVPTFRNDLIPYRLRPPFGALDDAAEATLQRLRARFFPPRTEAAPADVRKAQSLAALADLFDEIAASGAKGIFYFHPTTGEVRSPDRAGRSIEAFFEIAGKKGVSTINPIQAYRRAGDAGRPVNADGIHPDPEGAALIAGIIASALSPPSGLSCAATSGAASLLHVEK
jgi:predicted small lipoprotein YifL